MLCFVDVRQCCVSVVILATSVGAFQCVSDINFDEVLTPLKKGLAVDDTTFSLCSSRIPWLWPNTGMQVSSLRLFKAWSPQWPETGRVRAWENLASFADSTHIKVLVGTQITCNKEEDDQDWKWTKELLKMLKPTNVMGVAIGNELDYLKTKVDNDDYPDITETCVSKLWSDSGFWATFKERVSDLDRMGFESVPVTTVFTGLALAGNPFLEEPLARINSFFVNAVEQYGNRFVFTFNFYPYFDENFKMDPGTAGNCSEALRAAVCFQSSCHVPASSAVTRGKITQLTKTSETLFWIGETGWSSPKAESLHTDMAKCAEWSSLTVFRNYYEKFLEWELVKGGPDHVFYFDVRDSMQYDARESFGLISSCRDAECKIKSNNFKAPYDLASWDLRHISWYGWAWLSLGCLFIVALVLTCVIVRARSARQMNRKKSLRPPQNYDETSILPAVPTSSPAQAIASPVQRPEEP